MMQAFRVEGPPVGKARPRVTKWGAYTPRKTAQHEASIKAAAQQAGIVAISGPVTLQLAFVMPIPASWPKKRREAAARQELMPLGTPDVDNLCKAVMDALIGIAYQDDTQVVRLVACKLYGSEARTEVWIESVDTQGGRDSGLHQQSGISQQSGGV
jgi:Holliday junction resolvase RusA-like endonuclease